MRHIADLDAALARRGANVTLRRMTTPDETDLTVRASYRPFSPDEVTGGIVAGDYRVVISPTGLDNAAWIAAFAAVGGVTMSAPFDVDPKLPKKGDKIILDNRLRTVEGVMPYTVNGEVVRIEMQVR